MGTLIRLLFTGLLKRGLPILAGLGIGDLVEKITGGKKLPAGLPTPSKVYDGEPNRWQKMIVLAVITALLLTLITFILRKLRVRLPFQL